MAEFLELSRNEERDRALKLLHDNADFRQFFAAHLASPDTRTEEGRLHFEFLAKGNERAEELLADLSELKMGHRVATIGYGSGHGLLRAAFRARDLSAGEIHVHGVDPSASVHEAMARKLEFLRLDEYVTLHAGGIGDEPLPLPDGSLDTIWHLNSWYFWPSLEQGLRECHRLLKPGGRMLTGSKLHGITTLFGAELDGVRDRFVNTDMAEYERLLEGAGFAETRSKMYLKGERQPLQEVLVTTSVKA